MATFRPDTLVSDYFTKALCDKVVSDIKATLKERIMSEVEKEVDAAVDKVVAELGPQITTYLSHVPGHWCDEMMVQVKTKHLKSVA